MRSALIFFFALFSFAASACSAEIPASESLDDISPMSQTRELIILATPQGNDPYYRDVADDIFAFHTAYARQIIPFDDVLILTDAARYDDYAKALGAEHVVIAPVDDIWMRDFSLSNLLSPIMFRYSAAGQGGGRKGQDNADAVQESLAEIMEQAGLSFAESDLINDGGNFVDDYDGRAIISRKFLRDNNLSQTQARKQLKQATGLTHIAFMHADEQGGLEHADGVVAFIGPNRLVINSYPEDPDYAADLRADLESALPGVEIFEIITPYDGSNIYDGKFGSACGLYTNMLVTPERIYLPQFGIKEDAIALADMKRWSDKEIIPIMSQQVCQMGGGVRCMSWQLRGQTAKKMMAWAKTRQEALARP
jgi:agmatine deiminase